MQCILGSCVHVTMKESQVSLKKKKIKINRLPEKLENMSSEAVALEIQIMNKNITFLIRAKSLSYV